MKQKIFLALILSLLISGICAAQGNYPMGAGSSMKMTIPAGRWWRMPGIGEQLKLTSQEMEKLDALFMESRRKLIDITGEVSKTKLDLEGTLDTKDFNETASLERFKKMTDARANLNTEQFKFLIEVRKLLGYDRFHQLTTQFQQQGLNQTGAKGKGKGRMPMEMPVGQNKMEMPVIQNKVEEKQSDVKKDAIKDQGSPGQDKVKEQ
jgi:hypothetical protein